MRCSTQDLETKVDLIFLCVLFLLMLLVVRISICSIVIIVMLVVIIASSCYSPGDLEVGSRQSLFHQASIADARRHVDLV